MTALDTEVDYGDADKYVNDESIEMAWAIKAGERAEVHMNLITRCDTRVLRLNKHQDLILAEFRKSFPDLNVEEVTTSLVKDNGAKETWREFCEQFKEIVEDYSMGTLMRCHAAKAYSPENTVVVPKIIYLAVEMARNVEGVNEKNKASYTASQEEESKKQME
ncbi:Protein CBG19750 [Caenorhabditis briggsae]|uniref:Protein CBG19750 n=1 Tax=Caenorhabditis briggsae TaxID=6238 RepID=A8XWE4_CAEBR|nr:Protein CBG19750 [Caenorhabditis briggsae]CAP36963.1 Protein CBG19750 [Caenorhabditis briggsae]